MYAAILASPLWRTAAAQWALPGFSWSSGRLCAEWLFGWRYGLRRRTECIFQLGKHLCCVQTCVPLLFHSEVFTRSWLSCQIGLGEGRIEEASVRTHSCLKGSPLCQWDHGTSDNVSDSHTSQGAAQGGWCLSGEAALFSSQYWALLTMLRRHEPAQGGKYYCFCVLLSVFMCLSRVIEVLPTIIVSKEVNIKSRTSLLSSSRGSSISTLGRHLCVCVSHLQRG